MKITVKGKGNGRLYTRTGSKFLWAGYFLRGKEYRESTKTADPREAEKFLRKRLRETGADLLGARTFTGPQQEHIRVSTLLDWLTSDFRLRGKDSAQLSSQLKKVREFFGNCLAVAVTREAVDDFIEKQLEAGYKPATVNWWVQLLGQSYKLAVDGKHLSSVPRFRRLSESDNARAGFFSPKEFASVESYLPDRLKDFCRFDCATGCRSVVATGDLAKLIERRRAARQFKTDSGVPAFSAHVFHVYGNPMASFPKAWWSVCVAAGV